MSTISENSIILIGFFVFGLLILAFYLTYVEFKKMDEHPDDYHSPDY